jgi:sialic acid synthase SpsE/protoporphyrinogen oxidase
LNAYILGAGPAGLAAAYFLSSRGCKVTVIEKDRVVGGLSKSYTIKKDDKTYICDTGPHIFHSPDQQIVGIWKDLFGSQLIEGEFFSANVKGEEFDELHPYPVSTEGLLEVLGEAVTRRIQAEIVAADGGAVAGALTYEAYVHQKYGPTLAGMFFTEYPKKVWGIPTSEMLAEWAPKRLEIREEIGPFYSGQYAAVGASGTGAIFETLASKVIAAGGSVRLAERVLGLSVENNQITKIRTTEESIAVRSGDCVISTLPLSVLGRFLGVSAQLDFRGITTATIAIRGGSLLPKEYHWLYFGSPRVRFNRVTASSKMAPLVAPKSESLASIEFCYSAGDSFSELSDSDIWSIVEADLEVAGLSKDKLISPIHIGREPYVYPVKSLQYQKKLVRLVSTVERIAGLFSIGAGGEFDYADNQIIFRKAKDLVDDLLLEETSNLIKPWCSDTEKPEENSTRSKVFPEVWLKPEKNEAPFLIAEIGLNHNGSVDLAIQLVEAAKTAGADAAKFQIFRAANRVNREIRDALYSEKADGEGENIFELLKSCELTPDEFRRLRGIGDQLDMPIFFSAFDKESVRLAHDISPELLKISSMDLTNSEVIDAARDQFDRIVMSTGMSSATEIRQSLARLNQKQSKQVALLHCVSSYPLDPSDANLESIHWLVKNYGYQVGYSDHCLGWYACIAATCLGATIIEKHFTLDKRLKGPDHLHSITPEEFKEMAKAVRETSQMLECRGPNVSNIQFREMRRQKRGVYFRHDAQAGDVFQRENALITAPCLGLTTFEVEGYFGKRLVVDVKKGQPVSNRDF